MRVADTTRKPGKFRLGRISLLRHALQAFRNVLDEELKPLGITLTQLRMLWAIEENPAVSGAEVARLCSVTPQSGQATLAWMEAHGWILRKPSAASDRVLVAELTASGRRKLARAKAIAGELDRRMWTGMGERELADLDAVLERAAAKLER